MATLLKSAWTGVFDPLLRRPDRVQSAALCWRKGKKGKEVLLITSRDTGRWIIPKGWPIDGLDGAGTAAQEAWEEAGVKPARVKREPVGLYHYIKKLDNGLPAPVETTVYPIEVDHLEGDFPEKGQRKRSWMSPKQAAALVEEPELKDLLLGF
ncbi:NUDIX hydrolase [Celeribacter persicus]|jgi:NTP pyrophosphohydrolases including oxidative damage repair enzymes|uniref:8-oxo-dGTP pyrophosphatase MutT (NUDIX family) n=1 Tax=Celeribacter persicus TaxID=1651082 RepID=A0A2T5HVP6_9RHOB|nr:NUDIX hydrolase [Celeribacter persicus]PTQ75644.1 8-oxo-dGTP pyrophosphatase MutT (NUDIX family) [Celeribacter persicus]